MLKKFEKWLTDKEPGLHQQGFTITLSHSPNDINKPSLRVDLDSEEYLGRIVMWNTGECQIEIVNIETEETILDHYMVISATSKFEKMFSPFFRQLKINLKSSLAVAEEEKEEKLEFKFGHLTLRLATDFYDLKKRQQKSSEEPCLYFKEPKDMLFFLARNQLLQLNSHYTPEELLNDALRFGVEKVMIR